VTLVGAGAAPRAETVRPRRRLRRRHHRAAMLYGTNTRNERPLMDVLMFYALTGKA